MNQKMGDPTSRNGDPTPLIRISGVTFRRETKTILHDINIKMERGKITAIMGPSGCGKTTLLGLIGGQLRPRTGSVMVDGQEVNTLSRRKLLLLRRRMGMLFQSGALLTDINVYDNVAFPLREHTKLPESLIRDLVLMKLQAVGLRGAHALMPSQLSGGMARRVALARAMAMDPMMMMYDEPFTGQDPISMGVLMRLIKLMNQALGITTVLVSHDVQETLSIADYAYILAQGEIVGQGTPDELKVSESKWVRQFIDGRPDGPVPFHYPAPDLATELLGEVP